MTAPISVTDGIVSIRDGTSDWGRIVFRGQAAGTVTIGSGGDDRSPGEALLGWQFTSPEAGDAAAVRTLRLLMHHLATRTDIHTARVQLAGSDEPSHAAAAAAGFTAAGRSRDGNGDTGMLWRAVPPVTYTDGVVSIRRQRVTDIDAHLAAIDDEQIDWLWEPGSRPLWEALTPDQQRARNLTHLRRMHDSFGSGPKWTFSVDGREAEYVAYIDCDLDNNHVPAGQANISYTCHPAYRGRGYVSRAVRLVTRFLREHTGADEAHIIVDEQNAASLRVPVAVGAAETQRFRNEHGRIMVRHVVPVR